MMNFLSFTSNGFDMRAFILSNCEYSECTEKSYALLLANLTKGHHFIAQTEQRQFAFNTRVNPQNQNVYRWPISLLNHPYRGEVESVNIASNLEVNNLYTLTFSDGTGGKQYNLENWFSRYESGFEEACQTLRQTTSGRLKAPTALWQVLKLKLLSILRNPHNREDHFVHLWHQALQHRLPQVSTEFVGLIAQRPRQRVEKILHTFGFTIEEYTRWLANLYGMLSEGIHRPSLFERMFAALFTDSQTVKIGLYRYHHETDCCFFNDRGYCLQASSTQISIGIGLASDMFAIIHIPRDYWETLPKWFDTLPPSPQGEMVIYDNENTQRLTYNRLTVARARYAVYGKSNQQQDYF